MNIMLFLYIYYNITIYSYINIYNSMMYNGHSTTQGIIGCVHTMIVL